MSWIFLALAAALAGVAAYALRRRTYRLPDDSVQRELAVGWVLVATVLGAVLAAPFLAGSPAVVLVAYVLALTWGSVLTLIDLEVRRLPDALVLPAYPGAAVLLAVCSAVTQDWTALLRAAACAGLAVLGFLVLALLAPKGQGLGLGDVKLSGVLGALLGWLSWSAALMGLLTGFVLGGVGALVLVLTKRAGRTADMSFGPAMFLGAYLWSLIGVLT